MNQPEKVAASIAAVIGLAIAITILVVIPMRENIRTKGCPFVECPAAPPTTGEAQR